MLEVKMLLRDVESFGARVVLKDGAPRLVGKVPDEIKAQLKEYRSEIITYLSPAKETLFDVPAPEQVDAISKKDKRKTKEAPAEKRPRTVQFYCSSCFVLTTGRIHEENTFDLRRDSNCVFMIEGKFYCRECEYATEAIRMGKELEERLEKWRSSGSPDKAGVVVSMTDYFTGEPL